MVKEFSTFGSCSSRNIFAETSNKGYKDFFRINLSLESVTLISLMSKPLNFDSNLLNSPKKYDNFCVEHDFKKNKYLNFIKNNDLDFLVIDTYFDVLYSVIVVDDTLISASERLMHTALGDLFKNHERISIYRDLIKFMNLWTNACDSFFNFVKKNNPDLKIILNCSRPVYKYFSSKSNTIVESEKLRTLVPTSHAFFRDILDTYILENYDVYALPFDYNTLSNENHIWGLHPTHYEPKYYKEKTKQLNDIIELDTFNNYSKKICFNTRELIRENLILQYKQNRLLKWHYHDHEKISDSLSKYLMCRIDLKNMGNQSNTVELLEISDNLSNFYYPKWFCDNKGKGLKITSKQGRINLKIKCINNGELFVTFRGIDFRDDFGKRIPIYVKLTDININGEKINANDEIIWHDKPFVFRKNVSDSEIVNIAASWTPI